MNKSFADFERHLKKASVQDELIMHIMSVSYQESADEKQTNANYWAAVMAKCDLLLDFDAIGEAMFNRARCKSGFRLNNAGKIARDHGGKT